MVITESVVVAIAFVIFCAAVFKPAKSAILGALDKHNSDAMRHLDEAKALFEEAKNMRAAAEAALTDAEKTSANIIANAKAEVEHLMKDSQEEFNRLTSTKFELAGAKIEQQERHIIEQLKESIINDALQTVGTLLAKEMNDNAQLGLIDDSISKISKKLIN